MKIKHIEKDLLKSIKDKADEFNDLATQLFSAIALYKIFPENIPEFPPSPVGIEAMKKILTDLPDSQTVDDKSHLKNKESEKENFEMALEYTKSFLSNWEHYLSHIDITDIDSSIKVIDGCAAVSFCYQSILSLKEDFEPLILTHASNHMDKIGLPVSNKAHEIIGYLTAKIEERKKLKKNVMKGSKVPLNKVNLKRLWKEAGYPNPEKLPIRFLSDAMNMINRKERTVKNLIKEIAKEQINL